MPRRRRGEYSLAKSTSFSIFPITNSSDMNSDKVYYSAKNVGQETYKAKIRLNVTITPGDYTNITDNLYDNESFQQYQQSIQQKEKVKNSYRRELSRFFSRDFSKDRIEHDEHEHMYNRNRRHCRTISHDSSFRNSLKYSFEKIKLRAKSQKYAQQEITPAGEMVSLPEMMMTMQRHGLSGKNSWRKSRKMRSSIAKNGHYVVVLLNSN
ncbi:unnamed protein product [Onchocerca ochengi]|uniref:DUF5824 domain-containing protein n=1 Tax=Onchocerca ochengi TaxID=42157 RepID=A0A182ETS9_ONCOC|nr:unnamed protein product [Onchocerca ochengi]